MASLWTDIVSFCEAYGGTASFIGLMITAVGFIYTFRRIRQLRREMGQRLHRIGHLEVVRKICDARRIIDDLLSAAEQGWWQIAVMKCRDARSAVGDLMGHPILTSEEKESLLLKGINLDTIRQWIVNHRLNQEEPVIRITPQKQRYLTETTSQLFEIAGRLQRLVWESEQR